MKKILTALLFSAAFIGFQSCQDEARNKEVKDDKKEAEEHNDAKFDKAAERDAQFATDAYAASLFEIRAADTALKYAWNDDTRKLAEEMKAQHKKSNDQLRALATKKQITLPSDLTNDQLSKIENLVDKKDREYRHDATLDRKDAKERKEIRDKYVTDFDKKYASMMIDRHKDAIDLFEKASKDCTDKDLKDWFTLALPDLRKHLDLAMNTEKDLPQNAKK